MARKKSVTGKKAVASKSTRAKHGRKSITRVVTPPPLTIDFNKVFCVGGMFHRRFNLEEWNLGSHLESTLSSLIKESPKSHFYVHLCIEHYSVGVNVFEVPVAVVIQCDCVPTTLLAMTTLQSASEEIVSMDDFNMRWAPIAGGHPVSILRSDAVIDGFVRESLLLYGSRNPSDVQNERPEPVDVVSVKWNGDDVVWDTDEPVEDCCDDDLPESASEQDKATVKGLLLEEKQREDNHRAQMLEDRKQLFFDMMQQEDVNAEGLKGMKLFKVFPPDPRLEPATAFQFGKGPPIGQGGFRKTLDVNRYLGNADQYF